MTTSVRTRAGQAYFQASRSPRYSLLFALPLLLAYEGLAAALAGPSGAGRVRNGADVLLTELAAAAAGRWGPTLLMGAVVLLSVGLVARDLRRSGGGLRGAVFAGMLAESLLVATLFGLVVGTLTANLLGTLRTLSVTPVEHMSGAARLMLSLGAGLYEELLFRVLLVSALAAGARIALGLRRVAAGVVATVIGAVVFSAFHYVGPYGDPFDIQSFVYRAISGVAFSVLYLTRGFGITAWTHALYDVFVLMG